VTASLAGLLAAHPWLTFALLLAALLAIVSVAFLVGLVLLEVEWRIRSRRARRRRAQVDLTGVRP
jgi:hypothetical protein